MPWSAPSHAARIQGVKRTILRNTPRPGLGIIPVRICMVVAGGIAIFSCIWLTQAVRWPMGRAGIEPAIAVNLKMFQALLIAHAIWFMAVHRRWVPVESGTGLAVASCSVAYRCLAEVGRSMFGPQLAEHIDPGLLESVRQARLLGMVGYVAGLAFVASACLAHWRLRVHPMRPASKSPLA